MCAIQLKGISLLNYSLSMKKENFIFWWLVLLTVLFVWAMFGGPRHANGQTLSFENNLFYGITNSIEVQSLQEFLTIQGNYTGPITGNFYSLTLAAVKKFQGENRLPTTGYFGILSRGVANDILDASISAPIEESGTTTPPVIPPSTGGASTQNCLVFTTPSGALVDSCGNVVFTPPQIQQIQNTPVPTAPPVVTPIEPVATSTPVVPVPQPLACTLNVTLQKWYRPSGSVWVRIPDGVAVPYEIATSGNFNTYPHFTWDMENTQAGVSGIMNVPLFTDTPNHVNTKPLFPGYSTQIDYYGPVIPKNDPAGSSYNYRMTVEDGQRPSGSCSATAIYPGYLGTINPNN